MRIGKISAVLAAITVSAFASAASAQEQFSLRASPTILGGNVTFNGSSVNLQQTTSINCAVGAVLNVIGGAGSATANLTSPSISPGASPFCGILVFPVTPWSAASQAGQNITGLTGAPTSALVTVYVGANTIVGDPCNPQAVTATLTTPASATAPSTLTFNNVVLQAASGRPDRVCRINGVLTATSPEKRVFIH